MGAEAIRHILGRHKSGESLGLYSVCSAHRAVLHAAALQALSDDSILLVESTSNQVDQFGGYSGMKPLEFVAYVRGIAAETGLEEERIIFGGDHLGPNVWQSESAAVAMAKAHDQVVAYREAGYLKFHLDATYSCAGDPEAPLPAGLIAERTAELCQAVEVGIDAGGARPLYVIGSDVPLPGGATMPGEALTVTPVAEVEEIITLTRAAFMQRGLGDAWERVIAVVVQPGVEFDHSLVHDYRPARAEALSRFIETEERLVYEAHSTDYQTGSALAELVRDHFAILKVGPWLTFAFREAVFALEMIETEWLGRRKGLQLSRLGATIEEEMAAAPKHWQKHYRGTAEEQAVARRYSLSDRIRYYWPRPAVQESLGRLLANLQAGPVPAGLLSQFMPEQYRAVRAGEIAAEPAAFIEHKIRQVLAAYVHATGVRRL